MRVRASNRLIRFAYWPDERLPMRTSLCVVFWRTLFRLGVAYVILWFLMAFVKQVIHTPWPFLKGFGAFTLVLLTTVGLFHGGKWLVIHVADAEYADPDERSWFAAAFWAVKNRTCVIINIDREGV